MARTQEEIERGVLSFRREPVHEGVFVAQIALRPGESSTFHKHTSTRDTFYVLGGELTVTIVVEPGAPAVPYRTMGEGRLRIEPLADGREHRKVRLSPGQTLTIEPGVLHCAANTSDDVCAFLCIEGVGDYDFVTLASVSR